MGLDVLRPYVEQLGRGGLLARLHVTPRGLQDVQELGVVVGVPAPRAPRGGNKVVILHHLGQQVPALLCGRCRAVMCVARIS